MPGNLKQQIKTIINRLKDSKWSIEDKSPFIKAKPQYMSYNFLLQETTSLYVFCKIIHRVLNKNLFPNDFMFKLIIKKFGQVDLRYALSVCNIAINHHLDTAFTYSTLLDLILNSQAPDIHRAMEIFNMAKKRQQLNQYIFAKTIEVISKSTSSNPQLTIELFNEAEQLQMTDRYVFACALSAICKTPNPDSELIVALLAKAENFGWTNEISYSCALDAISRCKNPNLPYMVRVLQKINEQQLDSSLAYISIINVLVKQNKLKDATELFREAVANKMLEFPKVKKQGQKWVIDLHGYSYGTAYLSLCKILKELQLNKVSIICGKGSHYKPHKDYVGSEVRQATNRTIQEMGLSSKPNERNAGILDIELSPPTSTAKTYSNSKGSTFFINVNTSATRSGLQPRNQSTIGRP